MTNWNRHKARDRAARPKPTGSEQEAREAAREARLPQWTQTLLQELRNALAHAEQDAETARAAAEAARSKTAPADAEVTFSGPDGEAIGVPGGDTEISFKSRFLTVTLIDGGIAVEALNQIGLEPKSAYEVYIENVTV
jgi:hypothetical protein